MKRVSQEVCKDLIIKAFEYYPTANTGNELLSFEKLSLSDFESLSNVIYETINVMVAGKSIKSLLNGAGPKNSTINVICAFLLVKENVLLEQEVTPDILSSDNRFYVRRYFEKGEPTAPKQVPTAVVMPEPRKPRKAFYRRWVFYALLGILITPMLLYGFYRSLQESEFPEIYISYDDNSFYFPKDIRISYDLKSDNYLRNARITMADVPTLLQNTKGEVTLTVSQPNLYRFSLFSDNNVFDTERVLLPSDGWVGYLNHKIPMPSEYFTDGELMHLKEGVMLSRFSSGDYYTTFNTFKYFNVSGDDFVLEADVKNSPEEQAIWAYDIGVDVIGFDNSITFNLLNPDAIRYANMIVGSTDFKVGERKHVLEKLGVIVTDWQRLRVQCKDKRIRISLNNNVLIDEPYEGRIGQIVGLQFVFKGAGYLKNVTLNGIPIN